MLYFNKIIGILLLPPGIFIVILVFLTIYMYIKRLQGRCIIICCTILLYILSIPITTKIILSPLENAYVPSSIKADAIIVLGGGAVQCTPGVNATGTLGAFSANRLLTAIQLSTKYDIPIIVTGGQVFSDSANEGEISKKVLTNLKVESNKIIIENTARNTYENAVNTFNICKNLKVHCVYLVTSAWHMPRSMANFNNIYMNSNIQVVPYPCDYLLSYSANFTVFDLLPQMWALEANYLGLREYLGLLAFKIL